MAFIHFYKPYNNQIYQDVEITFVTLSLTLFAL